MISLNFYSPGYNSNRSEHVDKIDIGIPKIIKLYSNGKDLNGNPGYLTEEWTGSYVRNPRPLLYTLAKRRLSFGLSNLTDKTLGVRGERAAQQNPISPVMSRLSGRKQIIGITSHVANLLY